MPRVRLRVDGAPVDDRLADASTEFPDAEFRVLAALPVDTGLLDVVEATTPDGDDVVQCFENAPEVRSFEVIHADSERVLIRFVIPVSETYNALVAAGIVPQQPVSLRDGWYVAEVTASHERLSAYTEELAAADVPGRVGDASARFERTAHRPPVGVRYRGRRAWVLRHAPKLYAHRISRGVRYQRLGDESPPSSGRKSDRHGLCRRNGIVGEHSRGGRTNRLSKRLVTDRSAANDGEQARVTPCSERFVLSETNRAESGQVGIRSVRTNPLGAQRLYRPVSARVTRPWASGLLDGLSTRFVSRSNETRSDGVARLAAVPMPRFRTRRRPSVRRDSRTDRRRTPPALGRSFRAVLAIRSRPERWLRREPL